MYRFAIATVILLAILVNGALAAPVFNPNNGHYYEAVASFETWDDARLLAQSMSHLGEPGHLVTITSAAEQAWFLSFLIAESPNDHVHIGGVQDPGGAEPGSGWGWDTGETWSYTKWSPGEPNQYQGTNEDTVFAFAGTVVGGGDWADGLASQVRHYAVEYDLELPVAVNTATWGTVKGLFR